MQHILRDCPCCDMYLPIADTYDRLTAMVYDILVRGASPEVKPYLRMNLTGAQRFSGSKKLLRQAFFWQFFPHCTRAMEFPKN